MYLRTWSGYPFALVWFRLPLSQSGPVGEGKVRVTAVDVDLVGASSHQAVYPSSTREVPMSGTHDQKEVCATSGRTSRPEPSPTSPDHTVVGGEVTSTLLDGVFLRVLLFPS